MKLGNRFNRAGKSTKKNR